MCHIAVLRYLSEYLYIGVVHIEQLLRLSNTELLGVTDKNQALAAEVAERFGIRRVYASVDEILADPAIEVIHNCTPNNLHFNLNKQALLAGKHVLSEKPLALSAAESGELTHLAHQRGLTTGINFCYRYYPVVQDAAARVARGDLGSIYNILGSYLQAESTRRYAKLPSGHPMGYMDAVLNLFGDFYGAIALRQARQSVAYRYPDFEAGHDEMRVLEAAIASRKSGTWAKVG